MTRFVMEFSLDSETMQDEGGNTDSLAVASVLADAAQYINGEPLPAGRSRIIRDGNGNTIGQWKITDTGEAVIRAAAERERGVLTLQAVNDRADNIMAELNRLRADLAHIAATYALRLSALDQEG